MDLRKWITLIGMTVALAACGGGGDKTTSSSAPSSSTASNDPSTPSIPIASDGTPDPYSIMHGVVGGWIGSASTPEGNRVTQLYILEDGEVWGATRFPFETRTYHGTISTSGNPIEGAITNYFFATQSKGSHFATGRITGTLGENLPNHDVPFTMDFTLPEFIRMAAASPNPTTEIKTPLTSLAGTYNGTMFLSHTNTGTISVGESAFNKVTIDDKGNLSAYDQNSYCFMNGEIKARPAGKAIFTLTLSFSGQPPEGNCAVIPGTTTKGILFLQDGLRGTILPKESVPNNYKLVLITPMVNYEGLR